MSSPTTVPPSHRLSCTPEETSRAACLNGGTCFAWDAGGSRVIGCSCTSDWTGNRCELMYIDISEAHSPVAGLAVGLALGGVLIIAVVAIIVTLFYIRRKRRRERPTLSSSNHASISAVNVVDGKRPNGRLHKSNSEFGSVSQQTMSSIVAHEATANSHNKPKPLSMNYETQV